MSRCECHPDADRLCTCMKYNLELCEACADCRDPELYCKFREACVIWFLRKERLRAQRVGEQDRMAGKERGSV